MIRENYSMYLGPIFEDIVKDILAYNKIIEFTEIGRWWWKEYEIDLIAINQRNSSIIFIECKWQKNVNAIRVLDDLMEKKEHVDWKLNERQESFIIFAQTFYRKVFEYKGIKCQCFNLNDIRAILKTENN